MIEEEQAPTTHPTHRRRGRAAELAALELAPQPIEDLLRQLLERPLYTSPFAGPLEVAGITLLIAEGRLVQAFSPDGLSGDAAAARLPEEGRPLLRRAPEPGWVTAFATLAHPPTYRHRDLDSSFVDLPALADKLRREKFDGLICLEHAADSTVATPRAWILLARGRRPRITSSHRPSRRMPERIGCLSGSDARSTWTMTPSTTTSTTD